LISTIFLLLFDFFLSLMTDVNVPSKSKKQKNFRKKFFVDILSATDRKSRIRSWSRIRKSVVRIRKTGHRCAIPNHNYGTYLNLDWEAKCYHAIRLAQLILPVSSRTTSIEEAVVDKDEKAEKRDEDGVENGRDLGQERGGGQVQQGAAVHAHQQQALRP
jgi:hypothetical protein